MNCRSTIQSGESLALSTWCGRHASPPSRSIALEQSAGGTSPHPIRRTPAFGAGGGETDRSRCRPTGKRFKGIWRRCWRPPKMRRGSSASAPEALRRDDLSLQVQMVAGACARAVLAAPERGGVTPICHARSLSTGGLRERRSLLRNGLLDGKLTLGVYVTLAMRFNEHDAKSIPVNPRHLYVRCPILRRGPRSCYRSITVRKPAGQAGMTRSRTKRHRLATWRPGRLRILAQVLAVFEPADNGRAPIGKK